SGGLNVPSLTTTTSANVTARSSTGACKTIWSKPCPESETAAISGASTPATSTFTPPKSLGSGKPGADMVESVRPLPNRVRMEPGTTGVGAGEKLAAFTIQPGKITGCADGTAYTSPPPLNRTYDS